MSSPLQQLDSQRGAAPTPVRRWPIWVGAALLVLLAIGVIPRLSRSRQADATAHAAATDAPVVSLVRAKTSGSSASLELPGNTEAINVARIYARASGYISARRADIGTKVKRGQVLAVIDSPEIDQQLQQARANLQQSQAALLQAQANLEQARAGVNQANANIVQAQANQDIANTTNDRWTRLVTRGVLPKQAGDERRSALAARVAETEAAKAAARTAEANVTSRSADINAASAAINAQAANVHRLERLQAFETVVAPFDGVVTERKVERGDLVAADAGGERNMFSVAQSSVLRIQVHVPQAYAVDLSPGQKAEILVRERPGRAFTGQVARTADALDPNSRTLLSEVQVENSSGELLPGMYAQVKFVLPRSHPTIVIPGNALVVNSLGTRVAVVDGGNHVHLLPVQAGRDLGSEVEIVSGLTGSEQLITNPPDTLADGQVVRTAKPPQANSAAEAKN